jgi:hypothetical protein
MEDKRKKELIDFLKYIIENHLDYYGHLEIAINPDNNYISQTVEEVVDHYIKNVIH